MYVNYTFLKTRRESLVSQDFVRIPGKELPPGYKQSVAIKIKAPDIRGKYNLVFSVVQKPIEGTIASPYFNIAIE